MAEKSRLLWIGRGPIPQNVGEAANRVGSLSASDTGRPLSTQLEDVNLALVAADDAGANLDEMSSLLGELQNSPAVGVFLLPKDNSLARQIVAEHDGNFLCADPNADADNLAPQFQAAAAIQPRINKLNDQLSAAQSLRDEANHAIEELDEEMRLAARLQRDFLPRRLPEVGAARFAVLYRPATWVSGDIYDVVRLDETHVGFYVADVVGHGMPAALLTMFIKKAMQTKRILKDSYEIVEPHVSLEELNTDICDQDLPSCQFCTAVYCVFDTVNLTLTHARGGHPEPMVLHPDGKVERLWVDGSLLGVFRGEQYRSATHQLQNGDRLLIYTDGAEQALCTQPTGEVLPLDKSLSHWAKFTREEMLLQLSSLAETNQHSARPPDDLTILVLDIES